jgi:hypothetical protein
MQSKSAVKNCVNACNVNICCLSLRSKKTYMKNFKSILLGGAIAIASISTMLTSCKEDLCKDTVCANGGVCDAATGSCVCTAGFEGTDCKTLAITKFLGTGGAAAQYDFSDVSSVVLCNAAGNQPFTGTFTMSKSNVDSSKLILTNFGGFGATVTAYANADKNTLTIPSQTLTNVTPAITISGSGAYTAATGKVAGTYTSNDGTSTCTYNFTWTKK